MEMIDLDEASAISHYAMNKFSASRPEDMMKKARKFVESHHPASWSKLTIVLICAAFKFGAMIFIIVDFGESSHTFYNREYYITRGGCVVQDVAGNYTLNVNDCSLSESTAHDVVLFLNNPDNSGYLIFTGGFNYFLASMLILFEVGVRFARIPKANITPEKKFCSSIDQSLASHVITILTTVNSLYLSQTDYSTYNFSPVAGFWFLYNNTFFAFVQITYFYFTIWWLAFHAYKSVLEKRVLEKVPFWCTLCFCESFFAVGLFQTIYLTFCCGSCWEITADGIQLNRAVRTGNGVWNCFGCLFKFFIFVYVYFCGAIALIIAFASWKNSMNYSIQVFFSIVLGIVGDVWDYSKVASR